MKRIIVGLLLFFSLTLNAQVPGSTYIVPTISSMKIYFGNANLIYVSETNQMYAICSGCVADEVSIFAGAGGRKWKKVRSSFLSYFDFDVDGEGDTIIIKNRDIWNTAFSWGDHAEEGYLKSYIETDPVFLAHVASSITGTNISNWGTAYSWGNHASAGYALSSSLTAKQSISEKGIANGYAPLDASNKVPIEHLPTGSSIYKGTWNASTNTPTISDVTGSSGWTYKVTVAGTRDLGSGSIVFSVGDDVIHNGTIYELSPNGSAVTSVNSLTGTIVLTTDEISEGSVNKYYTDTKARTAVVTDGINNSVVNKSPSENAVFDALADKVDKIGGKGLSTEDYTTTEKTKLSSIILPAKQTHTSGSTLTINNTTTWLVINPASTIASLTLTTPASPVDGQKIELSFGGTMTSGVVITSLIISANSGQSMLGTSSFSGLEVTDRLTIQYNSSNNKWYR